MAEDEAFLDLTDDTHAIVASNLVSSVVMLRANRWDEKVAKQYVLKLYLEFRKGLRTNMIFHEGPPV